MHSHLSSRQKLHVAGTLLSILLTHLGLCKEATVHNQIQCIEKTDTMLWLHVKKTHCNKILVLSPDTGVDMIGLPVQCTQDKDTIVQVSDMNPREVKLIYMKRLIAALSNDPDLANVAAATHSTVLQTLFVVTGCDYIFFSAAWRKQHFCNAFSIQIL